MLFFEQCDRQYIRQSEKNNYTDKADCHAQVKVFYNKSHNCVIPVKKIMSPGFASEGEMIAHWL